MIALIFFVSLFVAFVIGVVIGAQGERVLCRAEHSVDVAREQRSASRYTVSRN